MMAMDLFNSCYAGNRECNTARISRRDGVRQPFSGTINKGGKYTHGAFGTYKFDTNRLTVFDLDGNGAWVTVNQKTVPTSGTQILGIWFLLASNKNNGVFTAQQCCMDHDFSRSSREKVLCLEIV